MRCYTKLCRSVLYFLVITYDLTLWSVPGELMTWLQANRSIATHPQQMHCLWKAVKRVKGSDEVIAPVFVVYFHTLSEFTSAHKARVSR